jgi:PTH1 family peptidyl-tRNA hydrolase
VQSKFDKLFFRGHNGIKSIIATVGGNDFKRLQIGIDRPNSNDPEIVAGYVLKNFSS